MKKLLMIVGAAAVAVGANTRAWALDKYWTGTTDNNWAADGNWESSGSNNVNFKIGGSEGNGESKFSELFKTTHDYRIYFDAENSFAWKIHVRSGTEAKPIVFYADSASHGLKGTTSKYNNADVSAFNIGTDQCTGDEAWLKIESGTYYTSSAGYWTIGGSSCTGHFAICEGATIASANDFDFRNGTVDVGGALTAKSIKIGNLSGGTATMTVSGGTVTNTTGATYIGFVSGATGALYLNEGGTLVTRNVYKENADATGTLVFNGGTLKASAAYYHATYGGVIGSTVSAKVGANGGTIDTGNLNITNSVSIADVDGEAGGLTVKGGGSLTVLVAQGYTGGTTVEAGTVLKLTTAAKESLVAHAVAVSVPDGGVANNTVVLQITDGGTFTQAEVDAMTLSGVAGPCYTLALAGSSKQVTVTEKPAATGETGDGYWAGGTDDNWATASNWQNGIIPTAAKRNAYFTESNFSQRFKDGGRVVLFDDKRVNTWKVHVRAGGSENAPVVFRATSAENGLTAGATGSDSGTGYLIGFDTGNGWLKIESGTYDTSAAGGWIVGGTYEGHVTVCEGAAVSSATDFRICKGEVTVEGGSVTVPSGKWTKLGEKGASALNLNGGTFTTKHLHWDANSSAVTFNGGTLKANYENTSYGGLIDTNVTANVGASGGTIDNGGLHIHLGKTLTGVGGIQLAGSGTTEITANQSYTGTTTVKSGTTISATGVTFAGAVAFETGSAVAVPEIPEGKSSVNILTAPTITGVENLPGPDENGNRFFLKGSNCLAWGRQVGLIISFH